MQELAHKHELHANQISKWKAHFLENAESVFTQEDAQKTADADQEKECLCQVIGQQKVEIDFF